MKSRPDDRFPPRLIQGLGILLLFGSAAFWAYSGHESVLFVGAALSLIGLGSYQQAASALRERNGEQQEPPPEPPKPPKPDVK